VTAIIGQMAHSAAFLGADTRRRDHGNGTLTVKRKLHWWSDQVIFAQGGAGTGAADAVVQSLFENRASIGPSVGEIAKALSKIGPPILSEARRAWKNNGKVLPPTSLTLATVCQTSGLGQIWSADLENGETETFGAFPRPTFSGTKTRALVEVASAINYELRTGLLDPLPFDRLVTETLAILGSMHPKDVQLPADIGFVTLNRSTGEWRSQVVQNVMPGKSVRPEFVAWFEARPSVANDL
jgi:hypothetical protein